MTVRCKVVCAGKNHLHVGAPDAVACEITLRPVWGDGKGNETWSKATPQGEFKMMITNPAAIDQFDLGKSYFVDFSPAE
jgi:hypothetical protein